MYLWQQVIVLQIICGLFVIPTVGIQGELKANSYHLSSLPSISILEVNILIPPHVQSTHQRS